MSRMLLLSAPFLSSLVAAPVQAAEPVLSQVVLSTGGVGQFSFTADVTGAATLPLDVPLDQVDDLLKSLHVTDPAGGRAAVRLQGREPLSETFRTLPFGPAAFASPEALLAGLVGETVRVASTGDASGSITGSILAVTSFETQLPGNNASTITRHRLTIATTTGIATAVLEETQSVEFTSDTLRRQIGTALSAIAAQRVQDRRTLQLGLGEGAARMIQFGYVVPVPVWKASYRLSLPAGAESTAHLQGYAVVENLSGRDWRGVDVVLTSGQPVLYHQGLYQAVFTQRPEAPVEVPNRLTPALDRGVDLEANIAPGQDRRTQLRQAFRPADGAFESTPAPSPVAPMSLAAPSPPPADVQQAIAQVEFHLAEPVTAASGESLLLPILDRTVPAQRVALFRAGANDGHPLVALMLTNDGQGAIPPGLATLYDGQGGFVGDARLPATQPGEHRLASFAADLPVRVQTTSTGDTLLVGGTAARGVLQLQRRQQTVTTYRVTTPASGGRTVLIEHPKRPGWTLTEPATEVAETPTDHRITIDVPAAATVSVRVVQQHMLDERLVLTEADPTQLVALSREAQLSPALRAALERAAALRADLDRRTAALTDLRNRRTAIVTDQDRLRRNLQAVPPGDLQRSYIGQLQAQESDLANLATQADTAQRAANQADAALKYFLGTLTL